ncbi:MAG TPA: hypothetical protein PKE31_00565 [Pseudomonadota bacterium]|nr:hypothetical protein [Pseudomonadota bacterium]
MSSPESVTSNERLGAATEQQLATDQQTCRCPLCPMDNSWRVDLRLQVQSQVPNDAVGYRLVLPGRLETDKPTLIPKRTRLNDTPFYSLSPFEYPDDLRLRDGRRYRIVWIDSQGNRMRLRPEQFVPGIVYSVGPASFLSDSQEPSQSMEQAVIAASVAECEVHSAVSQPAAAETVTDPVNSVTSSPSVCTDVAEAPALVIDTPPTVPAQTESLSEVTEAAEKAGEVTSSPQPPQVAPLVPDPKNSQEEVGLDPQEEWEKLLSRFHAMSREINELLVAFVMQPEYMIQLIYEEKLADAKARGLPIPKQPRTHLPQRESDAIHGTLNKPFLPSYFFPLCNAAFAHVRRFGTDQLATLPVPGFPLTLEMQRRMEKLFNHPAKRAYLQYCLDWQTAALDDDDPPSEPKVNLSAKECREFITMMQDMRYVSLFKKLTKASAS